jgi:FkbM family methyltransferase
MKTSEQADSKAIDWPIDRARSVERWYRRIRAITKFYPWTSGAVLISRLVGRLIKAPGPVWAAAGSYGACPAHVLDLSLLTQRKFFLFPRAYSNLYVKKPFAAFLRQTLRPGSTFLDVGANLGVYTWYASGLVGDRGKVIAFEPEPATCASLRRTIGAAPLANVTIHNVALSNATGEMSFYRSYDGFANSLLPEAQDRGDRYTGQVKVSVTSLDELARREPLPETISLVKVDVEGEEPRTVAGMTGTLERSGRPPIWCEVRGPKGSTRAPDTFVKVRDVLAPLGYRAYRWDGSPRPVAGDADVIGREDILFAV